MATYIAREVLLKNKVAKYDTWCQYTNVLLPGELAIVSLAVGDNHPITEKTCETPSYLIKVGDGEHTFIQLPWLESSANIDEEDIQLYGTASGQDYSIDNRNSYLELVTANSEVPGIGSYAPAIKFVEQGLAANLKSANDYTENFAYSTKDTYKKAEVNEIAEEIEKKIEQRIDQHEEQTTSSIGEINNEISLTNQKIANIDQKIANIDQINSKIAELEAALETLEATLETLQPKAPADTEFFYVKASKTE